MRRTSWSLARHAALLALFSASGLSLAQESFYVAPGDGQPTVAAPAAPVAKKPAKRKPVQPSAPVTAATPPTSAPAATAASVEGAPSVRSAPDARSPVPSQPGGKVAKAAKPKTKAPAAVAANLAAPVVAAPAAAAPDTVPEVAADAAPEETLVRRRRRQGDSAPKVVDPNAVHEAPIVRPMDPGARPVEVAREQFSPDPSYPKEYKIEDQIKIYGGKHSVPTTRPLLELGYPLYSGGEFGTGHAWFGEKNLVRPQFLVFGDFRTAYGLNEDAKRNNVLSARLNLELDLKLTGTERFHMLLRPLDKDGKFTRIAFNEETGGKDQKNKFEDEFNAKPVTAFFEGDLGQIAQGITNTYNGVDLPIAAGLVPLLFQNGVWMDDSIDGLALTWPAKSSAGFDISNMDFTAFAGFDDVTSDALGALPDTKHAGNIYGLASFIERKTYYYEVDYAYIQDNQKIGGVDHSYNNVSAAVTHRWKNWVSYSARVIHNFGQQAAPGGVKTADGTLVLLENSFFTRKPYTLVPYFNLFYGEGHPQSAARDAGAGGVLKNTGLNFETDGLTGFPKMDDKGADAYGGALGLEYLFSLDRQVVVEVAGLDHFGENKAKGSEYGLGLRYQQPISQRWIFRADGVVGDRPKGKDFSGVRMELRCKF